MPSRNALLSALAGLLLAPWAAHEARAAERTLKLDPAATKIAIVLGATAHDVEGTLTLQSGTVRFDDAIGSASGEIAIDLVSAQTGNASRDRTMHQDVLESAKFPLARFRPTKLQGTLAASGSSSVTLEGTLSFHGADHVLSIPAQVAVSGSRLTGSAEFSIPFVAWGLHDPSIFILRVDKAVTVQLTLVGELISADGSSR